MCSYVVVYWWILKVINTKRLLSCQYQYGSYANFWSGSCISASYGSNILCHYWSLKNANSCWIFIECEQYDIYQSTWKLSNPLVNKAKLSNFWIPLSNRVSFSGITLSPTLTIHYGALLLLLTKIVFLHSMFQFSYFFPKSTQHQLSLPSEAPLRNS